MQKIRLFFTLAYCISSLLTYADTLDSRKLPDDKQIDLYGYSRIVEDEAEEMNVRQLSYRSDLFQAPDSMRKKSPLSVYWVSFAINNNSNKPVPFILSYANLSFVHLYAFAGDSIVVDKKSGSFRPAAAIAPGDAREYLSLTLPAKSCYRLFLKVKHTKHFWPSLHFYLQSQDAFLKALRRRQVADYLFFGAIGCFLLYSLLSWIFSRYRPYLWLMLFIAATGSYIAGTRGYLIDWFTPDLPEWGWLWNIQLLHAGILGSLLLMTDFLQVKMFWPGIYRLSKIMKALLLVVSIVTWCIENFTSNYYLGTNISLIYFGTGNVAALYALATCRKTLTRPGRILCFGYLLFILVCCACLILFALIRHQAYPFIAYLGNAVILVLTMVFLVSLKEALREHETEKNEALLLVNEMHEQQNQVLEQLVRDKTRDLLASNKELNHKKEQLENRNQKIEILIQELHHRVKNNLQLLYGMSRLQLDHIEEHPAKDFLRANLNRIRAMSIVNEKLYQSENASTVMLHDFIQETARHVGTMYAESRPFGLALDIPGNIRVPANFAVPFGLIITELLTNSFKYAFTGKTRLEIYLAVSFTEAENALLQFRYGDNGHESPSGSKQKTGFSGLSLVKDLVRQLHGNMESWHDTGLHYQFLIPAYDKESAYN